MNMVTRNYFNNTKVVNKISKIEDLMERVHVGEFGKKKPDVVTCIDFKASDAALLSSPISQFEIVVMDAIYTLSISGKKAFTAEMIANVIAGKEVGKDKNKSTRFNDIVKAMERLSFIRATIDFSSMAKEKCLLNAPDIETKISGYVLPIIELRIKSRVKKIDKAIYTLDGTPILYKYAESIGRIVSVPASLLAIPGSREDILFSVLKREVIKDVALMKNKKNNYLTRTISYEWGDDGEGRGLFERIGLKREAYANEGQWRKKKSKINTMISQIMDHLVNENYIKGYNFNKRGGSITGVKVEI